MPSLIRRLGFSLILTIVILSPSPQTASAQTSDAKSKATGSISGRVTIGEKAASGVVVAAFTSDFTNRRTSAQTNTDSEGRYRLFGLGPGQYQITTLAPSLSSAETGYFYAGAVYGSGKNIILSAGETVEDLDLKLVRGGVITGRVTESDGKPLVDQYVLLLRVDQNGEPAKQPPPLPNNYQMYQTDDRGVYRIYGLAAGFYKVSVGSDAAMGMASAYAHTYYEQTFYGDVNDSAKAKVVELGEGSEAANIDIKIGHRANTFSATGHVVDADTGQPVTGVRIGYGPAPKEQDFSDYFSGLPLNSRGEFRIDGLEPGRYGVSISSGFDGSANAYSDTVFFEVTDTDVTNLEIKAVRGLSIGGVIVTDEIANKSALSQIATLRISANVASTKPEQSSTYGLSTVEPDGSFLINGLRAGKARLYINSFTNPNLKGLSIARIERDGVDVTQTLEIQTGQSLTGLRVFVMLGTGTIRGTLIFEGGTAPSGWRVDIRARREGSTNAGSGAQPDARGRFVISNLPAGTYEVSLQLLANQELPSTQRPPPPQKKFVTVADDSDAAVSFTVDLKPKEGGP